MRRVLKHGIIALAAISLSSCVGGEAVSRHEKVRRSDKPTIEAAAFASAEARQCLADLQSAHVRVIPVPNRDFGGGCAIKDAVTLLDIGTRVTNLGPMTCSLARNFSAWSRYAVRPAARKFLRTEVVRIETFGSYNCRAINGRPSGRLSQHAYANAVDVAGFVLEDGRQIMVKEGWTRGGETQEFLRALHRSACRRFGTVLGPDYNSAHIDHFHIDMSGNGYCR